MMRWEDTKHIVATVPTLKNHTATAVGSRIFVFGGYDGRRNHNDLHIFDCDKLTWETYSDPSTFPRPAHALPHAFPAGRNGHSATLAHDSIYILGGWLGSGPYAANDLHILHVSSMQWETPLTTGTPPGPCNMHTTDFLPNLNGLLVFRGGDGKEYLNDLHLFNLATRHWSVPVTHGAAPSPRANHSSAVLDSLFFVFGGWNGTHRLNDLHVLDTTTWRWSCVAAPESIPLPFPRAGMTFVNLRRRFYLFGGYGSAHTNNYPARCFNDLHVLDIAGTDETADLTSIWTPAVACFSSPHSWQSSSPGRSPTESTAPNDANPNDQRPVDTDRCGQLQPHSVVPVEGVGPSRRAGHSCTAVGRRLYIFGGSHHNEYLNDMHILDTDPMPQAVVSLAAPLDYNLALQPYANSPTLADISFIVEGHVVYGHKLVLSLASERFRAMFSTGFREATADAIVIPDMSRLVFEAMMAYVYSGRLPTTNLAWDDLLDLLIAADQYMLDHLKQLCERDLQLALDKDNVQDMIDGADRANAAQLAAVCRHFVRNSDDLCQIKPTLTSTDSP